MRLCISLPLSGQGSHSGVVVYILASEVSGSNLCGEKLVLAYQWSVVYSTEPEPTICAGFLCPQNYQS